MDAGCPNRAKPVFIRNKQIYLNAVACAGTGKGR